MSDMSSDSSGSFSSEDGLILLDLGEPEDDVDDDLMELVNLGSFNQAQPSSAATAAAGELHL